MGKTLNKPTFMSENTIVPITSCLEMLGINIDDQLKFDNHKSEVFQKSVATDSGTQAHKKMLRYLLKLDIICIYLSLFRILTIVLKRGIFAAKAPLTGQRK